MMNKRMLTVLSVAILAIPGSLWSQDNAKEDQNGAEVRIIMLKHLPARDASVILETLCAGDDTRIIVDESANRLILRATEKRMSQLVALIGELDVETGISSSPQSEPLLCRVYMVELPPKHSDLDSFSIVLAAPLEADLWSLLKAGEGQEFQIERFSSHAVPSEARQKIEIQGRAASNEIVKEAIARVPEAQIVDMKWAGRASSETAPAAQVSQLPEQLRQHIQKLLGADVQTVGYWFGGMSSPGEIRAPIGPWSIELKVQPTQTIALAIEVGVTEWRNDSNWSILENSIQGKAGRPIIIGYNRELNGTRTMGAMVILLEADTSGATGS